MLKKIVIIGLLAWLAVSLAAAAAYALGAAWL
jgi:hypothetical protein